MEDIGGLERIDWCNEFLPRETSDAPVNIDRDLLQYETINSVDRKLLKKIYNEIRTPELKQFVEDAFSNSIFVKKFITFPASKNHHHSYTGGLLAHSLECAEIVMKHDFDSLMSRDLAIVGALFHDVGKVWFDLEPNISRSARYLLHHDLLTINVLSQPLTNLREKWPDAEITLIYIWTWQLSFQKIQYPMMIEAELVKQADRASVMKNCHEMAFKNKEKWRQFSNLYSGGKPTRCWRPKSST